MKKIMLLTLNSLRVTFRNKGNYLVFLLLPVVGFIASIMLYSGAQSGALNIGVVNNDNEIISLDMIETLENTGNNRLFELEEDDVNNKLLDGAVSSVMIIPEGFTDDIIASGEPKVNIVSIKGQETTIWLENSINLYINNMLDLSKAANSNVESFDRIFSSYKSQELNLSIEKLEDEASSKMVTVQSLGFLIMFVMIGAGLTSELILKEKRNRTYHRICIAPVNSKTYVIGNVFANMAIVIGQLLFTIFIVAKLLNINTHVPDFTMLLILSCFGLVAVGLGMLVVSFSGSSYQSGTLSTLVITPTCMLGGCFWPIAFMPPIMQKIAYFMPQRWALDAVETIQNNGSLQNIVINLVILLAFSAVLFAVAGYKMSITDNMQKFV